MTMVTEDKEMTQNFQRQCEGDIKSLRNLTFDFMASARGNPPFPKLSSWLLLTLSVNLTTHFRCALLSYMTYKWCRGPHSIMDSILASHPEAPVLILGSMFPSLIMMPPDLYQPALPRVTVDSAKGLIS